MEHGVNKAKKNNNLLHQELAYVSLPFQASREKPGHCLFLSLYSPPLRLFVLYMTSAGICQVLIFLLRSHFCGSVSDLEPATVPLIWTVPILRPILMFLNIPSPSVTWGQRPYA